eukprot:3201484-Amphidinium_carterae.1
MAWTQCEAIPGEEKLWGLCSGPQCAERARKGTGVTGPISPNLGGIPRTVKARQVHRKFL